VTDVGSRAAAGAAPAPDPGRDLFLAGVERALQPLDDPAEIMSTVARLVGERLACDRCAYAEAEPDEDHFTMTGSYARGLPPLHGRMAMSDFSAETLRCMRAGEPYVVADAFTDERVLPEQRDIYRHTGITAVVCVPLHKGGRFVAAMAVHQARPRVWTADEIDLLTTVVARCWESLQRVHAVAALRDNEERYRLLAVRAEELLERERAANHRLRLLQDATAALSAAATPAEVGAIMISQLRQLLDVESVAAWELRDGVLVGLEMQNWRDGARERWQRMPLDAGNPVTDAVCRGEQVWLADDADWGGRYPAQRASLEQHGYTGLACLPLTAGGRCLGVAIATFTASRTPGPAERATAATLADQCAQALHRAGLLAAERRARQSAESFATVVAELAGATRPADVVELMVAQARMIGATGCAVVLHHAGRLEPVGGYGTSTPPMTITSDHPLARAVRMRETQWTSAPLAIPLPLSDRVIGAVGLWFADGLPGFDDDQRAAFVTAANQCAQALDRARLHQAEHEVAEVLQRSLLPAGLPSLARLAAAARYTPAAEDALSGGDWYDMLQVGDTAVALVVGDVVGHGPPAAAVMGQLRSVVAAHLLEGCSPAEALERLDRFAARVAGAAGSTCACLLLDWSTGVLRWALAGHPPVLLVDGPDTRFLLGSGAGTVLGVRGRPPYTEGSTTVAPGSSIVLYTDGLTERRGEVLDTGLQRLADAARTLSELGPDELVPALADAVLGEQGPADDVALLVVRAVPAPLSGRLPARGESMRMLRRAVGAWEAAVGLPAEPAEDLELALGEAAANAAEHAYAGRDGGEFAYTVARSADGSVEVSVRDHGQWRPVPEDNGHRGHGLRVIREIAEELRIEHGDDGTHVSFRVPVPRTSSSVPSPALARAVRPGARERGEPAAAHVAGDRVVVTGDLDLAGRDTVAPVLLGTAASARPLTIDLTGVRYLSSAGVALLTEAAGLAPSLSIVVAAGSAPARVCALTGLATAVPVCERPDRSSSPAFH
jgi:GAF domain-containing protein/anti-sigma regulatory factor (Ser/Thr protein kinase)/anti-anti-sigma regulatory factor